MACVTRNQKFEDQSIADWHRMRGQAVRFAAVGLSGAAVNTGLLALFYGRLHWTLLIGVMLASELAILNNFVWNDRWTFGCRGISVRRLIRFHLYSLGGLAIAIGTTLSLAAGGVPYPLSNMTGVMSGAACNFAVSMLWTWKTAP